MGQSGAKLMALAILVSTFGCNNGLILAGSRVYYAMARDGLFFRSVGRLHPRFKTPHLSLMVQAVWASILCLSGSYGQLLDYTIFAVLLFYILTLVGLFVLRRTRPDAPRPYRAFGYPWLPAIYIVMALFIDVVLLLYKPQYTWPGLVIVLLGIPVYFLWSRQEQADGGSVVHQLMSSFEGELKANVESAGKKPMDMLLNEAAETGRTQPEARAGPSSS